MPTGAKVSNRRRRLAAAPSYLLVFWNLDGLTTNEKRFLFQEWLECRRPDFICIMETWLLERATMKGYSGSQGGAIPTQGRFWST